MRGASCQKVAPKSDVSVRYLAPDGNDRGKGTLESPWRTLRHSVSKLIAGDTLLVRQGIYRESGVVVKSDGTADEIISIRAYPCEQVIIDGDDLVSRLNDPSHWELFDPLTRTYRSLGTNFSRKAYAAELTIGGQAHALVTYAVKADEGGRGLKDLMSTTYKVGQSARYVGPGIAVENGRLYVRLQPDGPRGSGSPFGTDLDAEKLEGADLRVSGASQILKIEGKHVELADLTLRGALRGVSIASSSLDTVLRSLSIDAHGVAVAVDDDVIGLRVETLRVRGDFPRWLAWTDMKGGDGQSKPAHHWINRASGLAASSITDLLVTDSVFLDVFDGLVVNGSLIEIRGNRGNFIDDMVQLGSNSWRVEIHHNRIHGGGISHYGRGDSPEPGSIYVHHNLIDSSDAVRWSREDGEGILRESYRGWRTAAPFPHHTFSRIVSGDPWKIYHNTVVFDGSRSKYGAGHQLWGQLNKTGVAHEVYNNIFVDVGDGVFSYGVDVSQSGQIYDGNVYWNTRRKDASMIYAAMPSVDGKVDFEGIESFRRSAQFEATRQYYYPGWDSSSVVIDPELDENLRPSAQMEDIAIAVELPVSFPGSRQRVSGAMEIRYP